MAPPPCGSLLGFPQTTDTRFSSSLSVSVLVPLLHPDFVKLLCFRAQASDHFPGCTAITDLRILNTIQVSAGESQICMSRLDLSHGIQIYV